MGTDGKSNVGMRLRTFRERQGWSLRALADRCGLSINAISRIERGENSPTVSSLQRLASALAVPITDFFIDNHQRAVAFIRQGEGERINRGCFRAEQLGGGLPVQQLEPYLLMVEPDCQIASSPISHPGQEFVYCVSGQVEYCVGEDVFSLNTGDSLLFEAMQPHYWRNLTTEPACLLMVFQAAQDNTLARQRHLAT